MKISDVFLVLLFPVSILQCLINYHTNESEPIFEVIYTPTNSSFKHVLQEYIRNRRFLTPATPKPLAIIAAKHESHVQPTVVCFKFHSLQIRIRSGGHDYESLSYVSDVPFVILDMFNLRSIDIDIANETAWVQAAATFGELYYGIGKASKVHAFLAGVCPTVSVGGHFSGGGYGNMMRKYRLFVDNIIDARLVDVNANTLDRSSMEEDLFWAIRGGGAASFGVILSWKINLVQVPETELTELVFSRSRSDYVKRVIPKEDFKKIWKMLYHTSWTEEGTEDSRHYITLSRKLYEAIAPYMSQNPSEAFLNYRDLDIGSNPSNQTKFEEAKVYGSKYFRSSFLRLVDVKKRVVLIISSRMNKVFPHLKKSNRMTIYVTLRVFDVWTATYL
ncbi:hypothetical protein GH714_041274 [Hevea brasiliensis]|uniref:FAD-binding PCMH-type domain-containing protein n=1 Tax=Hevea brasiliensis TaxID=3981 RepID=A0A6A6MWS5_HEVBR|nr:hypothetical protein GH714_041274 [Hevea brasiliensis]